MHYLLGAFAIVVPVLLVVQTIRGRVRVTCCAGRPECASDGPARARPAPQE